MAERFQVRCCRGVPVMSTCDRTQSKSASGPPTSAQGCRSGSGPRSPVHGEFYIKVGIILDEVGDSSTLARLLVRHGVHNRSTTDPGTASTMGPVSGHHGRLIGMGLVAPRRLP